MDPEAHAITLLLGPMWSEIVKEEQRAAKGRKHLDSDGKNRAKQTHGDIASVMVSKSSIITVVHADAALAGLLGIDDETRGGRSSDPPPPGDNRDCVEPTTATVAYEELFQLLDADHSGKVSWAEFVDFIVHRMFHRPSFVTPGVNAGAPPAPISLQFQRAKATAENQASENKKPRAPDEIWDHITAGVDEQTELELKLQTVKDDALQRGEPIYGCVYR